MATTSKPELTSFSDLVDSLSSISAFTTYKHPLPIRAFTVSVPRIGVFYISQRSWMQMTSSGIHKSDFFKRIPVWSLTSSNELHLHWHSLGSMFFIKLSFRHDRCIGSLVLHSHYFDLDLLHFALFLGFMLGVQEGVHFRILWDTRGWGLKDDKLPALATVNWRVDSI